MLNKKIIFCIIGIILISSILIILNNNEIKFKTLQVLGIKNIPISINSKIFLEEIAVGLPSPYYIAVIENDIFFNERFTGNLFVIKNGDFQKQPIINFSHINEKTKILGISAIDSLIFLHIADVDFEAELYENNRIFEYVWDGTDLIFKKEIMPKILFTDPHHSGGIIVDPRFNVYSTFPIKSIEPLTDYYVYGVHGFTFDRKTDNIWHTTEVDTKETWRDFVNDKNFVPDKYEKLHFISAENMNKENFWEVPYYPNSLLISGSTQQKLNDSLFVGFCKGEKSKGGIYEYPLDSDRTDFAINYRINEFRQVNHSEYLIAENFYCVSDIEVNSRGDIYMTDYTTNGAIYKISKR